MLESVRLAMEAQAKVDQAKATAELCEKVAALQVSVDRILGHFETRATAPAPAPAPAAKTKAI